MSRIEGQRSDRICDIGKGRHVLELIILGYRRLNAPSFHHAKQDEINGELVRAIELVLSDPEFQDWVDRYIVQEQIPQTNAIQSQRDDRL